MPCLRLPATIAPMKPTECLRVLLAAFALGASSPVTAQDDVLVLRIDDIEPVAGAPVIVRVYDRAGWLQPEKALRTLHLHPHGRTSESCSLPISKDMRGTAVALEAFQDLNGNGKLDMHWFPWPGPSEPVGFANGYRPRTRPRFEEAVVPAGPGNKEVVIHLRR